MTNIGRRPQTPPCLLAGVEVCSTVAHAGVNTALTLNRWLSIFSHREKPRLLIPEIKALTVTFFTPWSVLQSENTQELDSRNSQKLEKRPETKDVDAVPTDHETFQPVLCAVLLSVSK